MATSQTPMSVPFFLLIAVMMVIILSVCWLGSRDRAAQRRYSAQDLQTGRRYAPQRSGSSLLLILLVLVVVLALAWYLWPQFVPVLQRAGQQARAIPPAGLATPAQGAPPSDMLVGPPSITAAMIDHILVNNGSPAAGIGATLITLGKQYKIDPVYALAFFHHESDYGRRGIAVITHSWGNIKCTVGWRCDPTGRYRSYVLPNAKESALASWERAASDWFVLISRVYLPHGLTTLRMIIPVYAPAGDDNNEQAYIQAVLADVALWRNGKEVA